MGLQGVTEGYKGNYRVTSCYRVIEGYKGYRGYKGLQGLQRITMGYRGLWGYGVTRG